MLPPYRSFLIHVEVKRAPFQKLAGLEASELSATVRRRVDASCLMHALNCQAEKSHRQR
jgi:hypothetical protein